jgi:hypothetical protein
VLQKKGARLSGDGFGFVSENLSECFSVRYEIFRLTRQSKRGRKISNARDSPRARDFRGRVRVRVPIKRA